MTAGTLPPPSAVPARTAGAPVLGAREYALAAVSLAAVVALLALLSPVQLGLYAAVAACGYFIAASPFSRNAKGALVLAALAGFLYLLRQFPRPDIPFVLWGGFGIEVFFVLRLIDYAVSPHRRDLCLHPRDRVAQYLLYLFFLPTLFSGPSVTFSDLYRSYRPGTGHRGHALMRNAALVGWGATKFYVLRKPIEDVSDQLRAWGMAGETPYGWLDPHLSLWLHVCVWMVYFYVMFSGFTDMATGASRLLGFGLYDNFEHPFVARDPGDYWKRWNVSGRKWLIKHVFYPYWGHGQTTLKVMTTFWASGLWHLAVAPRVNADAAIQLFAAVSIYGAAVAVSAWVEGRSSQRAAGAPRGRPARYAVRGLGVVLTFLFTALIHQVFWGGMLGLPVARLLALLQGLFWLR